MPDLADLFDPSRTLIILLIAAAVALVLTLDAAQHAVGGAWPHQRRPDTMLPSERAAHAVWGLVALAVVVGGLVLIANLAVLVWQDLEHSQAQVIGGALLAVGWLLFLLVSIDRYGIRRTMVSIGLSAPVLALFMLVIAIALLGVALSDIWPGTQELRESLPGPLRSVLVIGRDS